MDINDSTIDLECIEYDPINFLQGLKINLNALHEDMAEHSSLVEKVGNLLATAKLNVAKVKINRDLRRAEIGLRIRANPETFSLTKATEGAINQCVEVETKQYDLELAEHTNVRDKLEALATAFEHRRSMLNNEVSLFNASYWGTSDVSGGAKEEKNSGMIDKIRKVRGGEDIVKGGIRHRIS